MIWTPLPGGGPNNGYRYRDTLRPLATQELQETYVEALGLIEQLAEDPAAPLGDWKGHGPALSVLAQWAVYALRDRGILSTTKPGDDQLSETDQQLLRLARLQQKGGLYQGFPGIHYGKSIGWQAPTWWGAEAAHQHHQEQLIALNPEVYTREHFAFWAGQRDWRWVGSR
ncbi:Uncharacterised protein [Mycobacteroides abscessus subsp. abscessus]|uniref:hypothetical protein n=1 Tax=Mycobacteroides abscessus TaxID=36809 RepID=UPI00092A6E8C|nr:hypothetical protein [Mycobacteroides abscessus]SHU65807.1 Uncharacterised protein [Mycobacteroides abscessus subsp. abscessus]